MKRRIIKRNLSRLAGLITIYAVAVACKSASTVTYAPPFTMDLSAYRPRVAEPEQESNPSTNTTVVNATAPVQNTQNVSVSGTIQAQLNAMREAMAASNKNLKFSQGFRLVIYSGGSRDEANKVMADVRKITTEIPELVYEQPNFRVKLGNFFNKTDAFALYTQIKSVYPHAVITNERITIPLEKYRSN